MTAFATLVLASVALLSAPGAAGRAWRAEAVEPIRSLIVTGRNNHNWRYTSRVHKETLEATGRFNVDITDDPPATLGDPAKANRYSLFVLDYNGARWGEPAETNFVRAVRGGAGVVIIHAANNAFAGWSDYERMCALMWIDGQTSHGTFHEFDVRYTDKAHPITRGLRGMAKHPDELYHNMIRMQGSGFDVLATAFSSPESRGSGKDEPMALVLGFGDGRVFHTALGHVWEGQDTTKRSISDPQFRVLLCRGAEWAATGSVTIESWRDTRPHNTLTAEEKAAGWTPLFDGRSPGFFRGFRQEGFPPKGWVVEEADGAGALRHVAGAGGGDIVTREQYSDFEFACEWKVAPGGNSGIFYRVKEIEEAGGATYRTGPEMQVLDNAGHADGKNPKTSAGSLYGLVACGHDVIRPAGEWNSVRIVVKGDHVEHWANGSKVVEYSLAEPGWSVMLKGTKFEAWPRFGREKSGHIALQDHGDDVWYRDIKVRRLD